MRTVVVRNVTRNTILARRAGVADTFWLRLRGLLGRRGLEPGEGLVIRPTAAVHTFLMQFDIDVVHVDRHGRVIHMQENMGRGRTSSARGGVAVVELPAGTVATTGTKVGDQLTFQ